MIKYAIDYPVECIKEYLDDCSYTKHLGYFRVEDRYLYLSWDELNVYRDWCLKNHFDINGLIADDLAIDATDLNIY